MTFLDFVLQALDRVLAATGTDPTIIVIPKRYDKGYQSINGREVLTKQKSTVVEFYKGHPGSGQLIAMYGIPDDLEYNDWTLPSSPRCECGASTVGSNGHSGYCPKATTSP